MNFVNTGIIASLVIVKIVSGIIFFNYISIQYVAVTQNINTILSGADDQELSY